MLYTLGMFLAWGLALALIGGVVGWLLRSLKSRSQAARAERSSAGEDEVERLRGRVAELEGAAAERDRLRMELADVRGSTAGTLGFSSPPGGLSNGEAPGPRRRDLDLAEAGSTLGRDIDLDDLTIVEGIGPSVAEVCATAGITTWRQLAETDVATLERILATAGEPVASLDPSSWPRQAGLLAAGRWEDFTDLTRRLDGS